MQARSFLKWSIGVMVATVACTVSTELGKPCTLVKLNPADGGVEDVQLSDIQLDAGQDFISFGTSECEDLVCILDADHLAQAADLAVRNPGQGIQGYCSKACQLGSKSDCAKQFDGLESTDGGAMSCRSLVLDQATLNAICTANPSYCQQVFGGNPGSNFCARGRDPTTALDGGH